MTRVWWNDWSTSGPIFENSESIQLFAQTVADQTQLPAILCSLLSPRFLATSSLIEQCPVETPGTSETWLMTVLPILNIDVLWWYRWYSRTFLGQETRVRTAYFNFSYVFSTAIFKTFDLYSIVSITKLSTYSFLNRTSLHNMIIDVSTSKFYLSSS